MKKSILTGAIAVGVVGTVLFATTVGDKEEIITPKEELYSLTPDEIDAYDEYDYEELLKDYEVKTARIAYPVSAAITENDNVKLKSADTDILGDILSYTDGNKSSDTSSYVPVQNNTQTYTQPQTEYSYVEPQVENNYSLPNETNPDNYGYNNADREVISYFNEAKEQMREYLNSDDYTNLKAKAKSIVVTGVDFLFYDGTIKGFTRKELTEKGKEEIILSVAEAFDFIDEYYPGFSDSFGSKYTKVKEFLSEKFAGALDKVKDWIGTDEYAALGEDFKDIGDILTDVLDEHYQGWKMK